jgi:hypothetical protein
MTATPPKIKAIETRYKGHRFRSRLEARWAVVFDAAGIEWRYEDQGYELEQTPLLMENGGSYYLPDFWLPQLNMFFEVKGDLSLEAEQIMRHKMLLLCDSHPLRPKAAYGSDLAKGVMCEQRLIVDGPDDDDGLGPFEVQALQVDETNAERTQALLQCPICSKGLALEMKVVEDSRMPPEPYTPPKGVVSIQFRGDCCHKWILCFRQYGWEVGPLVTAYYAWKPKWNQTPLKSLVKDEHLAAGKSARFEHGECG